jgi:glycerate 2-kinase
MTDLQASARRDLLKEIFLQTLQRIDIARCMAETLQARHGALTIGSRSYDAGVVERVVIVSVGKAGFPMMRVAHQRFSEAGFRVARAVCVGSGDSQGMPEGVEVIHGSHPLPDVQSRTAALRVMDALQGLGPEDLILFLISGGSSAMIELPLDQQLTIEEVTDFHRALVHSGLDITAMNTIRKHFSAVKGGRLAAIAERAQKHTLLISDVPEGQWDVIGSGPSTPDRSTREDCRKLLQGSELLTAIPPRVRSFLLSDDLPETPKEHDRCFVDAHVDCPVSTATMLHAAVQICQEHGWDAVIDTNCDDWEYRDAANYLMDRVESLVRERGPVCVVSGGEVLVTVGAKHGSGGRNQQFALYCATQLPRRSARMRILSAGSDGIDGVSPAAGAIVDETTLERARQQGLFAGAALDGFDAYPFFHGLGDVVCTGPTGNNVRDLRILFGE